MFDRGLNLTLRAVQRQLSAMPHDVYLVRLIHQQTRRAFPGERLWTASQLLHPATLRFMRLRNREGCDVYIQPYAERHNPGYILVDLDGSGPEAVEAMRADGLAPSVVLQTSPGNLQVWMHVSTTPLEPAVATSIGKQLAQRYGGDLASTDWRHLGRLAGFTNHKPQRRNQRGHAPWVKILHAQPGLAAQAAALLLAVPADLPNAATLAAAAGAQWPIPNTDTATQPAARSIYADWLQRLRILQRFPQPDWSIADKWIAKELLRHGMSPPQAAAILRAGSPGFPRRHSHPDDYLRRTLARAFLELQTTPFPRRHGSVPTL
ncbi:MAG TPA: DNA-primase RepB domain-containing protein [Terriglobales bacterium]|nr:DNA-primase RepB domain-containing protein [Terriglobales bacterium]